MKINDLIKECDERLDRIDNLCKQIRSLLELITNMHEDNTVKELLIDEQHHIDLTSLYDVNLRGRTRNSLLRRGFKTVGQIRTLSERQILGIPGIGKEGIEDIKNMLVAYGLELPKNGLEKYRNMEASK